MEQYKLILGCFLICALCYGLKCEECKRDDLYSYHCEGFCNGSLTVLCDETTTTRASISEKTKASGTLSTGAGIGLGAVLVVIVIFVILYVLKRRMRLSLPHNNPGTNNGVVQHLQQPTRNHIMFISGSEGKNVIIASTSLKGLHTLPFLILFTHIDEFLQTIDGLIDKILNTTTKRSTDILVQLCNV
ncbi:unnamed protein product [Mytilus edulis]|uniref:Uncharacterized protein n=1 Tax=Mytilus edulis TaxID=6550 RepID=A0A8S3QMZ1_MYTED|nr:unnamed protein product [Mytilus edulis]